MSEMLIRYGSPLHVASHRSRIPQISQEKSPIEKNNNPPKNICTFSFHIWAGIDYLPPPPLQVPLEASRGVK